MAWSFWEKETWLNKYDIIIVGAGFVGLWTAYKLKLKEPHLKIAIIEKGVLPTGASTKNAGFSCFGSVSELMHDVALMGESAMLKVVEMRYKGLKEINATFPQHSIDYHNLGGYELFSTTGKYPIDRLRGDIYYLNNLMSSMLGLTHTFHETSEKIAEFGFQHVAALAFSPSEGQLHPAKLVQNLQQMVQQLGVTIFFKTTVEFCRSAQVRSGQSEQQSGLPPCPQFSSVSSKQSVRKRSGCGAGVGSEGRAKDVGEGAAECGVTGHFKEDQQRPKFTCSNVARN